MPIVLLSRDQTLPLFIRCVESYPVDHQGNPTLSNFNFLLSVCARSCPTLCDSMDCSPPGFSVHGISQVKNTGTGCNFFLQRIFPTQGSNLRLFHLLHWQMGSLPLGLPEVFLLKSPVVGWWSPSPNHVFTRIKKKKIHRIQRKWMLLHRCRKFFVYVIQ